MNSFMKGFITGTIITSIGFILYNKYKEKSEIIEEITYEDIKKRKEQENNENVEVDEDEQVNDSMVEAAKEMGKLIKENSYVMNNNSYVNNLKEGEQMNKKKHISINRDSCRVITELEYYEANETKKDLLLYNDDIISDIDNKYIYDLDDDLLDERLDDTDRYYDTIYIENMELNEMYQIDRSEYDSTDFD